MFTLLRRIRKKLLDSGASRKYIIYALGEVLLVVIGILIALQINNWNEYRKDRAIEQEILRDLLDNLEANNELIRNSVEMMNQFDRSTDIVLDAIENKTPYSDSLALHLNASLRTGGLMFPLSSAGYESLKNEGFNIILSKSIKDKILQLFEVTYERIKAKAGFTMDSGVAMESDLRTLLRQEPGERSVPIDYPKLLEDDAFFSIMVSIKESRRGFLKSDVIDSLQESEELIRLIRDELDQKDER